jgi:hypothetical protein
MSSIFDGIGDDGVEQLDENLRKWFKEKWVRFGPDGKIRGACARGDDSEGKPKCLPQKKAQNLGKKGRKYAASKKRREDPNPERRGPAKNVATKKKTNEGVPFDECPKCRGPIVHESMMTEKQDACYHKVKSRYKVWPSAYASGALVQCRKKGASNWGTGGKKNESNIMKGLVNEEEYVSVLYIDGNPLAKYAVDQEARQEIELLKKKFPNKHFELKREARGGAGGNEKVSEGVIISTTDNNDPHNPQVAVLGGAGSYSFENLKKKALGEAKQLATDIANGEYKNSAYNVKQLANTLNTIVAAEEEMKKLYFGEDYTGEFAAEKTPAINPYGGLKDNQFRGAISETPTDNPTGASGEGGWRKYKPKPAGEIDEDTAYAGGMGQGGNAGESYRKFKPKSAGTFKEDELDEACWKGYHKEGNKKMFGKTYPNCVKNTNEEEQLDEKCWDTHKQVGMKNKGGKQVPNCVPKESAIMKGLKR